MNNQVIQLTKCDIRDGEIMRTGKVPFVIAYVYDSSGGSFSRPSGLLPLGDDDTLVSTAIEQGYRGVISSVFFRTSAKLDSSVNGYAYIFEFHNEKM